jgi:hypothetical protein
LAKVLTGEIPEDSSTPKIPRDTSGMFRGFHPSQSVDDLLTPERRTEVGKLLVILGHNPALAQAKTWVEVTGLLKLLRQSMGLEAEPTLFTDRTRRAKKEKAEAKDDDPWGWYGAPYGYQRHTPAPVPTLGARWPRPSAATRAALPKGLQTSRKWDKWVKLVGTLVGRASRMVTPAMKADAATFDKFGIFHLWVSSVDPASLKAESMVLALLMQCEFCVRKAFTLDSQVQGGLNRELLVLYNWLLERGELQADVISTLLPIPEVLERVEDAVLVRMVGMWVEIVSALSVALSSVWPGVKPCATSVAKPMVVQSGANSDAWNCLAGAWSNARRMLASLTARLGLPMLPMYKCMKLLAYDQFRWAKAEGKEDFDSLVFGALAQDGLTPWSAIETGMSLAELQARIDVAVDSVPGAEKKAWRCAGVAKMRDADKRAHADMICGVAITPDGGGAPVELVGLLKAVGAFGSNLWTGS